MNNAIVSRALAPALVVGAVAAFGCDRDNSETQQPKAKSRTETFGSGPPAGQATVNNDQAVQRLADARCEREARCNNVGQGKQWASADACRTDLLAKNRNELNASECPAGVVQKELDECLADVRKETCDSPLDTLTRLAACRSSDLCKATGM